jgi:hypothetical protein
LAYFYWFLHYQWFILLIGIFCRCLIGISSKISFEHWVLAEYHILLDYISVPMGFFNDHEFVGWTHFCAAVFFPVHMLILSWMIRNSLWAFVIFDWFGQLTTNNLICFDLLIYYLAIWSRLKSIIDPSYKISVWVHWSNVMITWNNVL